MIKLNSIQLDKVWGYEKWIASTHPNGMQKDFYNAIGGEYPLLVKIIHADENLSIQVHPDDEKALQLEGKGSVGKTECWYVLDAEENASLVYGLNIEDEKNLKTTLEASIKNNSLEKYLNVVPVKKGDFIFIPSGTVHAICKGLHLLEIQQSCDITYRLYDWGRERELHIDKGIQVVKPNKDLKVLPFNKKFSCDYFNLEEINVKGGWGMFVSSEENTSPDQWQLIYILDGKGKLKDCATNQIYDLQKEQIYAVGPKEKITVEGEVSLIRIKCGKEDE